MISFYENIEKRLENIGSFKEARDRIDVINEKILEALEKRSKYPVCEEFFQGNHWLESDCGEYYSHNWWKPVYSKIVKKICDKGEFKKKL